MTEIYSRIEPDKLLHFIIRDSDINVERYDAICEKERLQLAVLNMKEGKTFKAHKHKYNTITTESPAMEIWVCTKGAVQCTYYDTDGSFLAVALMQPGDLTCTIEGGHNYESMEEGTRVMEIKSGPYFGQEHDKEFL